MSVLLYPNPTKDAGLAVTRQAAALLRRAGVPLLALQGEAQALSGLDVTFLPQAEAFRTDRKSVV